MNWACPGTEAVGLRLP